MKNYYFIDTYGKKHFPNKDFVIESRQGAFGILRVTVTMSYYL